MATNDNEPEQKRPVGRPLKFETVEQLDLAIQNYFAECDPHTTQALVETGRDSKGNMLFDTRTVLTEQKPCTMSAGPGRWESAGRRFSTTASAKNLLTR
jgi:hypothetical protein